MTVFLMIPWAHVRLQDGSPVGRLVPREGATPFKLRWTDHHPQGRYGLGVLVTVGPGGTQEILDGHQFRHLRDSVGAWLEAADMDRVRGALGLPVGERMERQP